MKQPANHLSPKVRTLWRLTALPVLLVWMSPWLAVSLADELPAPLALLIAHAGVPFAAVIPRLRYRHWRYEVSARDVIVSWGVIRRHSRVVPRDSIREVRIQTGPLDHRFGLAKLVIDAGARKSVTIPGLLLEEASRLRGTLDPLGGRSSPER